MFNCGLKESGGNDEVEIIDIKYDILWQLLLLSYNLVIYLKM